MVVKGHIYLLDNYSYSFIQFKCPFIYIFYRLFIKLVLHIASQKKKNLLRLIFIVYSYNNSSYHHFLNKSEVFTPPKPKLLVIAYSIEVFLTGVSLTKHIFDSCLPS